MKLDLSVFRALADAKLVFCFRLQLPLSLLGAVHGIFNVRRPLRPDLDLCKQVTQSKARHSLTVLLSLRLHELRQIEGVGVVTEHLLAGCSNMSFLWEYLPGLIQLGQTSVLLFV